MRVLNIAPQAQWMKYDDDLSIQVRRITVHESLEIVRGTPLEPIFAGKTNEDVDLDGRAMLILSDRIFAAMVTGWTVQDPDGRDVPVSEEAGRWLMTETPAITGWLVNTVFLGVARAEMEVETEKKD